MSRIRLVLAVALLSFGLAAQELPQRFAGTGPDPVQAGEQLDIQYSDPSRAGQKITVDVFDMVNTDDRTKVVILLGPDGRGSAPFVVPAAWTLVVLQNPNSADLSIPVTPEPKDAISTLRGALE